MTGARADALTGCLLGTAVADAIALPFEGLSRRRVARWWRTPLQHRFLFGRGLCSDDTEHTCMVGQALLAAACSGGAVDVERFRVSLAWRLRWWLLGLPAGIGLATLRSIARQWLHPFAPVEGVWSAGNGPAMRSALIGVQAGDAAALRQALVRASTRLTHTDPRAEHGAQAVALAAAFASRAAPVDAAAYGAALAAQLGEGGDELLRVVDLAVASALRGEATPDFAAAIGCGDGVSGFTLHTVPVAVHAWLRHADDYDTAIETVIRCGGDTDTVAAIVGGLVGARVGPAGIPSAWVADLREWPRSVSWMRELARRLAAMGPGGEALPPVPLNPALLLARNAFFMACVLVHGFRRLLPPYR